MDDIIRFVLHLYLWIGIGALVAVVQGWKLFVRRRAAATLRRQQIHSGQLAEPIVRYNMHLVVLGVLAIVLHLGPVFIGVPKTPDKPTAFLLWLATDAWGFAYGFTTVFFFAVLIVYFFEDNDAKSLPSPPDNSTKEQPAVPDIDARIDDILARNKRG